MKNSPSFGVAAVQVTTHPIFVKKIEGSFRGAVNSWLQVHDLNTTPSNGTAPIKSWPILPGTASVPTPFKFDFIAGELGLLNGLYICVSTTDGTKTLSAEVMDLEVETTNAEEPATVTVVGDKSTGVNELVVWSEAVGPKRLHRLDVTTGIGGNSKCLMLFATTATPADGSKPVAEFSKGNASAWDSSTSYTWTFGKNGRDSISSDTVLRKGCHLVVSNTRGTLTINNDLETAIRAEYIT